MEITPKAYDTLASKEAPLRVFYDTNGKIYKAEKPKDKNHSEMNFPNLDIKRALPDDGSAITREEMISNINQPDFGITVAVLAANQGEKSEETTANSRATS